MDGAERGYIRADAVDREVARPVLVGAFPQDDDVAKLIAKELRDDYPFNMETGVWQLMPNTFRDNAIVVQALDEWTRKIQKQNIHQVELSYAALVGRTPTMKQKLLDSLDGWVPFWAVRSLLEGWGMADADVAARLRSMALTASDPSEIARYIPSILQDPKEARKRLLTLLRDSSTRRADFIVNGFSQLSERGDEEEIVHACLDRLQQGKNRGFDEMFVHSVILTFKNHQKIRELSLAELEGREPPVGAIAEAFASDADIRRKVAELLTPTATDLRTRIVSELPSCGDPNFALDLLRHWDSEVNPEVKTLASIKYNSLLLDRGEDTESSLSQLSGMLPCYGPDHEERRQASLAGLLILRRLDVVKGKSETIGFEGQPVAVELSSGLKSNRVLLECIGKRWEYVKETLGSDFIGLFQRSGKSQSDLWSELARVGADYPALARDILRESDRESGLLRLSNVLAMIARLEPRSDRLLDSCLNVLSGLAPDYNWFEGAETASSLLAEQFRNDPAVEKKLLEFVKFDHIPTGVLMALCKGWPQSELLLEVQSDEESAQRASEVGVLYPKYATAAAIELPALLESDLARAQEDWLQKENLVNPVLARMRNDPPVVAHLFEHLTRTSNPSVMATFSRFIAAAGALTGVQARWYREEIARQSALRTPDVGIDLFAHAPRAVNICLLESLGEAAREAASAFSI
jgi:hypothetical protein